jgi:hypothetical protein
MNPELTVAELDAIHIALITRERTIVDRWLPSMTNPDEIALLESEVALSKVLQKKICVAKLSKELGFDISSLT